jgi:hypothetical protein
MNTKCIKLSLLSTDRGIQTRAAANEDTIEEYAQDFLGGSKFPAIDVFTDGSDWFLVDGFHRVLAANRAGLKDILANVYTGAREDAVRWALTKANRTNGLRRTNADKRHSVFLALREFPNVSDRTLADMCGVSHPLVADARKQLEESSSSPASDKRTGKDGRTRKLPTSTPKPQDPPTQNGDSDPERPRVRSADEELAPDGTPNTCNRCGLTITRDSIGNVWCDKCDADIAPTSPVPGDRVGDPNNSNRCEYCQYPLSGNDEGGWWCSNSECEAYENRSASKSTSEADEAIEKFQAVQAAKNARVAEIQRQEHTATAPAPTVWQDRSFESHFVKFFDWLLEDVTTNPDHESEIFKRLAKGTATLRNVLCNRRRAQEAV